MVAQPCIKDFLLNKALSHKRASWVTKVMEYDVQIKVAKLVRGKGLCEQLNEKTTDLDQQEEEEVVLMNQEARQSTSWTMEMKCYLAIS